MPTDYRRQLKEIRDFRSLIPFLRDEMNWPISQDALEDVDDLFFDYTAEELGVDAKVAAKIKSIKQLRPLHASQPWGVFFVTFEPKRLPVVALRRILSQVAVRKRASSNAADRAAWKAGDLLFVSSYGEGEERQISFAHFTVPDDGRDLPTLKVLGWDNRDTSLHLDAAASDLTGKLSWPADESDHGAWRQQWRSAFSLRLGETVTTSKELSIRLAELARAIRDRIKTALAIETDKGELTKLMKAFQEALVHDLDNDGFADMYAQTIAYGLLSARIADPHKKTADDFAAHMRTNPFLRELMETFLKVGGRRGKAGGPGIDFDELGVSEVVELLDDANMEAVVADFGDRNPQEDPVIHFYELFLKEYDAKKRMQRGVFYTPRPVVSYIILSVDELLRTEFGLEDGLADTTTWGEMARRHKDLTIPEGVPRDQDFVQILDPATGTGTFLVEVIDLIHKTLVAKWKARGHGKAQIDALWNEYVPKHLLTRVHGYELLMAPYAIAHLKIGLKLYETGYRFGSDERARVYLANALEPPQDFSGRFNFAIPAIAHEAKAVNEIKQNRRFTAVVGNPPYSNFGQMNRLPFILGLLDDYKRGLGERKLNLDDDYIKFVRLGQWAIDQASVGLLAYISASSYLDGAGHRRMRQLLLTSFGRISVVNLHGNLRKKEVAPNGERDENVFDIMQGVAIALMRKTCATSPRSHVQYADVWGARQHKYGALSSMSITYDSIAPSAAQYFLVPQTNEFVDEYMAFASLKDIFHDTGQGIEMGRTVALAGSRRDMEAVVRDLETLTESSFASKYGVPESSPTWGIERARRDVSAGRGRYLKLMVRPFDEGWTFYTGRAGGFHHRPRTASTANMLKAGNRALVAKRQSKEANFTSVWIVDKPINQGFFSIDPLGRESLFPALREAGTEAEEQGLFGEMRGAVGNIRNEFIEGVRGAVSVDRDSLQIMGYVYAVLHSPAYRRRYAEFLRTDFPRVPRPRSLHLYRALGDLGGQLISLHLLETSKPAQPLPEFFGAHCSLVEKISWSRNTVWLDKAQTTGFTGVPEEAWNFHIGGYQVCEKWLKDRKGRTLTKDDIAHYQKVVVAISETISIMKEIDALIEQHGGWPGAFVTEPTNSAEPAVDRPGDLFIAPEALAEAEGDESHVRAEDDDEGVDEAVSIADIDRAEVTCQIRDLLARPGLTGGVEREALLKELSVELGFKRLGPKIRESLHGVLIAAARRDILETDDGRARLVFRSIAELDREFLKEQFLASLEGTAWWEREVAIRDFARWFGFRRTGSVIEETARSLINGLIRTGDLESRGTEIRKAVR